MFIYLILAVLGLRRCTGFSVGAASGLLSGCTGRASHCGGFSVRSTGSGMLGFQSLQLLGATAQASLGLCAWV